MHRVVTAQLERRGELSRFARERRVDPEQRQFGLQRVSLLARPVVPAGRQAPPTARRRERRATFWVDRTRSSYIA